MKNLKITVNGTTYDVQVEEVGSTSAPSSASVPAPAAPAQAAPAAPAAGEGTPVVSPMPGKVLDIKVAVGDTVKEGDPVVILEAMKMENPVNATGSGTITSVLVSKDQTVETDTVLVTIG
ncbi:MAG: acetyl-CoA carboxylase biotin carboxyl carrier protein subunit [Ruminococcus sp.]|nr:acetyl-CoA carboxylase biotin carboxyl carrier protein subunit [Ruminococcus sp.]